MEVAEPFHLEDECVGKLELIQRQAQRIHTSYGCSVHGIDYVSRKRPSRLSKLPSDFFRGDNNAELIAQRRKH